MVNMLRDISKEVNPDFLCFFLICHPSSGNAKPSHLLPLWLGVGLSLPTAFHVPSLWAHCCVRELKTQLVVWDLQEEEAGVVKSIQGWGGMKPSGRNQGKEEAQGAELKAFSDSSGHVRETCKKTLQSISEEWTVSQNSYVGALPPPAPTIMWEHLEIGLKEAISVNEIIRVEPWADRAGDLIKKEETAEPACPLSSPCEDPVGRRPSVD